MSYTHGSCSMIPLDKFDRGLVFLRHEFDELSKKKKIGKLGLCATCRGNKINLLKVSSRPRLINRVVPLILDYPANGGLERGLQLLHAARGELLHVPAPPDLSADQSSKRMNS